MVKIGALQTNIGVDVASSASITLGSGNFFNITGSTTITSIAIKPAGTMVVLTFGSNDAIIRDGSGLRLNRDYYAENSGGGNTLTLLSDGTNWVEVARFPSKCRSVVGVGSRDMGTASSLQVITSLGFRPSIVILFATKSGDQPMSVGLSSENQISAATGGSVQDLNGTTTGAYTLSNGAVAAAQVSPGVSIVGNLDSFDDNGFTISWVRNSSPTGTFSFRYLAIQ